MVAMPTPISLFRKSAAAYDYIDDLISGFVLKEQPPEVILALFFLHESVPSQSQILTLSLINAIKIKY